MDLFMTGNTRCRNMQNALGNVARCGKPAVIRADGKFFEVTHLSDRPVQPGQHPFTLRVGETVHNWEPAL